MPGSSRGAPGSGEHSLGQHHDGFPGVGRAGVCPTVPSYKGGLTGPSLSHHHPILHKGSTSHLMRAGEAQGPGFACGCPWQQVAASAVPEVPPSGTSACLGMRPLGSSPHREVAGPCLAETLGPGEKSFNLTPGPPLVMVVSGTDTWVAVAQLGTHGSL